MRKFHFPSLKLTMEQEEVYSGKPGAVRVMPYRLITLAEAEPLIWRRMLVPADTPLDIFHRVIQGAMGWSDYHAGKQGRRIFGVAGDEDETRLCVRVPDEGSCCRKVKGIVRCRPEVRLRKR